MTHRIPLSLLFAALLAGVTALTAAENDTATHNSDLFSELSDRLQTVPFHLENRHAYEDAAETYIPLLQSPELSEQRKEYLWSCILLNLMVQPVKTTKDRIEFLPKVGYEENEIYALHTPGALHLKQFFSFEKCVKGVKPIWLFTSGFALAFSAIFGLKHQQNFGRGDGIKRTLKYASLPVAAITFFCYLIARSNYNDFKKCVPAGGYEGQIEEVIKRITKVAKEDLYRPHLPVVLREILDEAVAKFDTQALPSPDKKETEERSPKLKARQANLLDLYNKIFKHANSLPVFSLS